MIPQQPHDSSMGMFHQAKLLYSNSEEQMLFITQKLVCGGKILSQSLMQLYQIDPEKGNKKHKKIRDTMQSTIVMKRPFRRR